MKYDITIKKGGSCVVSWITSPEGRHFENYPTLDAVLLHLNATRDKLEEVKTSLYDKNTGVQQYYRIYI